MIEIPRRVDSGNKKKCPHNCHGQVEIVTAEKKMCRGVGTVTGKAKHRNIGKETERTEIAPAAMPPSKNTSINSYGKRNFRREKVDTASPSNAGERRSQEHPAMPVPLRQDAGAARRKLPTSTAQWRARIHMTESQRRRRR